MLGGLTHQQVNFLLPHSISLIFRNNSAGGQVVIPKRLRGLTRNQLRSRAQVRILLTTIFRFIQICPLQTFASALHCTRTDYFQIPNSNYQSLVGRCFHAILFQVLSSLLLSSFFGDFRHISHFLIQIVATCQTRRDRILPTF